MKVTKTFIFNRPACKNPFVINCVMLLLLYCEIYLLYYTLTQFLSNEILQSLVMLLK